MTRKSMLFTSLTLTAFALLIGLTLFNSLSNPHQAYAKTAPVAVADQCSIPIKVTDTKIVKGAVKPGILPFKAFQSVLVKFDPGTLPPCFTVTQFTVKVQVLFDTGAKETTVTVAGDKREISVPISNFIQAARNPPQVIRAEVSASATKTITGKDDKTVDVNG